MLPSNPPGGNKYYSIEAASAKESRNTLLILAGIIAFGLINIYFAPVKYLFINILNIQSINGCPLLTFAGIPCPFCGMGRVFSCLTDLYIARSFYYNPMGLVFYIALGFTFSIILVLSLIKKKIVLKKPAERFWYIPVLFIVLMWILNILYGHQH